MIETIRDIASIHGVDGDIVLYRDDTHKKQLLAQHLKNNLIVEQDKIVLYSQGAFAYYVAKAFEDKQIHVCGNVSDEYKFRLETLPNVVFCNADLKSSDLPAHAEQIGAYFLDQFSNPYVTEHYKMHFAEILSELDISTIHAFCDCGHSCGTLAGFLQSELVDWRFVLGVNGDGERPDCHYLNSMNGQFVQVSTKSFDTQVLRQEIELAHPLFGNVYEATRSISAAMKWLSQNPGKRVLVYVGDSTVFGGSVETKY